MHSDNSTEKISWKMSRWLSHRKTGPNEKHGATTTRSLNTCGSSLASQGPSVVKMSIDGSDAQIWDKKRQNALIEGCYKSWQAGRYTDIKIIVGSQTFAAHKLVLVSLSDYFEPLFEHDSNAKGEITLHNIEPDIFSVLLEYAYTGTINLNKDTVQSVLIAADYLSVSNAREACETFMTMNLDPENVCDALQFASGYSLESLWSSAVEHLKKNLPNVSTTSNFSKLDPKVLVTLFSDDSLILSVKGVSLKSIEREKLILKTVLQYLSDRNETDPATLGMVFQTARLVALSKDEIKNCLKKFKHLRKNETIMKYVRLRDVAVHYLQQRDQDCSLTVNIGGREAEEIPDAWLRRRKLAKHKFIAGRGRYAAGGHVAVPQGPPRYLYDDPDLEIERVDIWIRRWDGRPVIGGLALTYRPYPTVDQEEDGETAGPLQYCKGHCASESERDHFSVSLNPDEFIVKVTVSSGFLIDRLAFMTSSGRTLGPFGGPGGGEHTEETPEAPMSYLYDINFDEVVTQGSFAIYNLMFRWIAFE
ncbi:kelch-like protein 20 [Plakobranchus ocellatus]|uniref:Kelch-like protein 20 n=1 Tax=Plakobranchus ocellatus TaxID=259542 RepID=A0AAV3XJJ5_9GAST|nr:kelch-like protein 20 [Plakobranchus ocellatus]